MANIQGREYHMYQVGNKYRFVYHDGYQSIEIKGTTKEIAFAVYKDYLGRSDDGYGLSSGNWSYGPFFLEERPETKTWEVMTLIDTIVPEPEQSFWDEMNKHINRFFETLTAFS